MSIKFSGFVVLQPLNPWDAKHKDLIYADMAMSSFARTPELSWRKFIGYSVARTEAAIRIQRYHDRGYRVAKVDVEILEPSE